MILFCFLGLGTFCWIAFWFLFEKEHNVRLGRRKKRSWNTCGIGKILSNIFKLTIFSTRSRNFFKEKSWNRVERPAEVHENYKKMIYNLPPTLGAADRAMGSQSRLFSQKILRPAHPRDHEWGNCEFQCLIACMYTRNSL